MAKPLSLSFFGSEVPPLRIAENSFEAGNTVLFSELDQGLTCPR